MELTNPAQSLLTPECASNTNPDGSLVFNPLGGGWEVQGLNQTARVKFEITASPEENGCGIELELQASEDGCFDLPHLNNFVFWDFCIDGQDCRDPMTGPATATSPVARSLTPATPVPASAKFPKRASSEVMTDHVGHYMIAADGTRIPVYYQNSTSPGGPWPGKAASAPRNISKRQSQPTSTYNPPQGCTFDTSTCTSAGKDEGFLAICVDCVTGQLGPGFRASPNQDCSNDAAPCPITFMESVTVTNTVSFSLGADFGNSGEEDADASISFGLSDSFSVAVTRGVSFGLTVPVGHVGFAQYQPPADAGSIALVPASVGGQILFGHENICGFNGANPSKTNMVCEVNTGFLSTMGNDMNGQYSLVLLN
jgi:hypothetical protein